MALPPLDHFLSPVPAYGLAASLSEITQALGQPGATVSSHLVVTDDEHRPLGAIALGRLWACHQAWRLGAAGGNRPELQLLDCQSWLEPVVEVVASQLLDTPELARLGAVAQETPAPTLVLVDGDGLYLGVLNPARLLGWVATDGSRPDGAREADAAWLGGGPQAWVMELSHALKTPITTLLGLSTLLLDSRVGSLSDRQFRYVSLMRQAIRKLTGLVNLLLDWMRLESDQISLNLERVYLQPLADTLLPSFLNAQAEARDNLDWADNFTVCLTTDEDWVRADPLRLRQSLHYSLGYLTAHGAAPGGLVVEPWGPWLSFTLWSSTSIPVATLPGRSAAGEFQLEEQREPQSPPQSLEGLGLTLAQRFSQLHGGELSCLSTAAWGSRLTLLLPAPGASTSSGETALVLLACASEAVVDLVYGSLKGSAYRLAIAPCCQTLAALQERLGPTCTLIHWESLPDAPTPAAARQTLVQRLGILRSVVLQSPGSDGDGGGGDLTAGMARASALGSAQPAIAAPTPIAPSLPERPIAPWLSTETLAQRLKPTLDWLCQPAALPQPGGLTVLLLRLSGAGNSLGALPNSVQTWLQHYRCRLLQVDDLAQASLLSRVWQPHAVILDGLEPLSLADLQALARHPDLTHLPLVTLVPSGHRKACQALGLTLVSCPEVLTQPLPQGVISLLRAIAARQPTPGG